MEREPGATHRPPWGRYELALVVVLTLVPFVRAIVLWRHGWVPVGDNANIAIRSADLGTRDTPLIGMPSGLGTFVPGSRSAHPGPLVFWVIGPWVRVFGQHTLPVLLGSATVAAGASLSILWCARRQAGRVGLIAAVAILLMVTLLTPYELGQPLNPATALLPALAALMAAVSVAAGDDRAALVLVVAASFAAQAELAYTPVMVAAVAAAVLARFHTGDRGPAPGPRRGQVWATSILLGLCWMGPLLDVVGRQGGNALETFRVSQRAAVSPQGLPAASNALRSIVHPFGWVSWADDQAVPRGPGVVLVSVLALFVGLAVVRVGHRDRRPLTRALGTVAAAAVAATVASQAMTPEAAGRQIPYLLPVLVVGGFVWYSLWTLTGRALVHGGWRSRPRRIAVVAMIMVVLALGLPLERIVNPGPLEPGSEAVTDLRDQAQAELPAGRYVLIPGGGPNSQSVLRGVGFFLEDRGHEILYPPDQVHYVGPSRVASPTESSLNRLLITRRLESAPSGWRRVARSIPSDSDGPALRRVQAEVADAARSAPLRFTHQAASFQIGQVLAATGSAAARLLLDEEALNDMGADLLANPEELAGLSDVTLATLIEENVVARTSLDGDLTNRFFRLTDEDELELWLVPAEG